MKNFKKVMALLLAVAMIFAMAACGKKEEPAPSQQTPVEQQKPAEQKPAEQKPAEQKPAEQKPAEQPKPEEKPAEQPKPEQKPATQTPAEQKPATKPVEQKPVEQKPAELPEVKPTESTAPEVVKGVTIPEFKLKVAGVKITNEDMAAYDLYKYTANTVNSSGTAKSNVYIGFKMSDVIDACGLTGEFGKLTAIATDGYEVVYEGNILADNCLIAISKDGTQLKNGPWFAPGEAKSTGNFAQDLAKIEIEGAKAPEKAPEGGEKVDTPAETPAQPELKAPVAEDKSDKIKFADFSFKVNDKEVTNADLEGLRIFRITVTTQNSKGAVTEAKYSGYILSEVLAKMGIENPKSVKAVANDGYENTLSAEDIASELTIIAIEKDKATAEDGSVWMAPCNQTSSKAYGKGIINIVAE